MGGSRSERFRYEVCQQDALRFAFEPQDAEDLRGAQRLLCNITSEAVSVISSEVSPNPAKYDQKPMRADKQKANLVSTSD